MADASLNLPYIIVTGVTIGAAVIVLAVLRPQLSRLGEIQDNLVSGAAKLQERQDFLQTIDRKLNDLNQQKVHEDRLVIMLPEDDRAEDALRIVHRAAEGSGVIVTNLANTSSDVRSGLNTSSARGEQLALPPHVTPLAFSIEFNGSYQQLRSFITELERSPRLIDIHNLEIQGNEENPGSITGQLVTVFYMQNFNTNNKNP